MSMMPLSVKRTPWDPQSQGPASSLSSSNSWALKKHPDRAGWSWPSWARAGPPQAPPRGGVCSPNRH